MLSNANNNQHDANLVSSPIVEGTIIEGTIVEGTIVEETTRNKDDANLADSYKIKDATNLVTSNKSQDDVSVLLLDESKNDTNKGATNLKQPRTFASSNFKAIYARTKRAHFQHNLLGAVEKLMTLYAARLNPTLDEEFLQDAVQKSMQTIQTEAFKNDQALQNDVDGVAEYLWTSAKKFDVVNRMELCSVINAVIRDDIVAEIKVVSVIIRNITSRCVQRSENSFEELDSFDATYPTDGTTWRGGGFRNQFQPFFERMRGKKYRVPGFLATSNKRRVATNFAFTADNAHSRALWKIDFDRRGKYQPDFKVRHMTFVSNTLVKGEGEYLFAPYSVFKLVALKWSENLTKPHELTLAAAVCNMSEDETLPLAPWY